MILLKERKKEVYSQVSLNGGNLTKNLSDLDAFDNVYKAHGSRKGCPAFP